MRTQQSTRSTRREVIAGERARERAQAILTILALLIGANTVSDLVQVYLLGRGVMDWTGVVRSVLHVGCLCLALRYVRRI